MVPSEKCINLIKQFEGFRGKPYLCPAGVPTIGYGSTRYDDGVKVTLQDESITEQEASELLADTLKPFAAGVSARLGSKLNQNQFDALVSFVYNVGLGKLESSTLFKKLFSPRTPDYKGAAQEFDKWVHGGGKILPGLVKRRVAERALFEDKA